MDVVVTTKDGSPVAGLKPEDFSLKQDGSAQPIASVREVPADAAISEVVIVLDNTNSYVHTMSFERTQLETFLRANGGRLAYPTSLEVFDDKLRPVVEGATTDGNGMAEKLHLMDIGEPSWRHRASEYSSIERLQASLAAFSEVLHREARKPGHKLVVWISPGWPTPVGGSVVLSKDQIDFVMKQVVGFTELMRRGDITVDNVNPIDSERNVGAVDSYLSWMKPIKNPHDVDFGYLQLNVFAAKSGGVILNSNDVGVSVAKAIREASGYYELTFSPMPGNGEYMFHTVDVRVAQHGAKVLTNDGYFTLQ
jgi:VWFA-related protein